jgi:hypothetical protein
MSARFNSLFLNQTTFDSASPLGSAVVVHRFDDEGEYDVELGREGAVPDRVVLSVAPRAKKAQASQASSVTIDVAGAAPGTIAGLRHSKLDAGGYTAFTSAHARSSGSVIVARKRGAKDAEFDSRRLGEPDIFAVTLVRPGLYAVRNTLAKAEGRIVVTYPVVGERPYRPADPVGVLCTTKGFDPERLEIGPAQGIIFRFDTAAHLVVELLEPDDGPKAGPRGRWSGARPRVKPKAPPPS